MARGGSPKTHPCEGDVPPCGSRDLCRLSVWHAGESAESRNAKECSAMGGHHALARQGGATPQRHSVQCSDDQRNRSAWGVTRKGGRTVDRQDRASRSRGRDARAPGARSRHAGGDARAPGAHSRHAGATPAHPARTFTPQPSCGRDARAPGAHSRHAGGDARAPAHSRPSQRPE
jgi:hypothetical protein